MPLLVNDLLEPLFVNDIRAHGADEISTASKLVYEYFCDDVCVAVKNSQSPTDAVDICISG